MQIKQIDTRKVNLCVDTLNIFARGPTMSVRGGTT